MGLSYGAVGRGRLWGCAVGLSYGAELWGRAVGLRYGAVQWGWEDMWGGEHSFGAGLWDTAIGLYLWGRIYGAASMGQSNRAVYGATYGAEQ